MEYETFIKGRFIKRPNRFITHCILEDGKEVIAHLPNTGRCAELLVKGAEVFLNYTKSETRKTDYSLYMVKKGERLINVDSQAPNKIVKEGLENGGIKLNKFKDEIFNIKSEYTYGNSRFDFYLESSKTRMLLEVKGVTLESENIVSFPDAPSLRALKHIEELILAKKKGIFGCVIFLVQMEEPIVKFTPNVEAQKKLQLILKEAELSGVEILAFSTKINKSEIIIDRPVKVDLNSV